MSKGREFGSGEVGLGGGSGELISRLSNHSRVTRKELEYELSIKIPGSVAAYAPGSRTVPGLAEPPPVTVI